MRVSKMMICWVLVLPVVPFSRGAQANSPQEVIRSAREFVEGFYKWYVPRALSDNATGAWNAALRYRSSAMSVKLAKLLQT
jgi:hypothetical protein